MKTITPDDRLKALALFTVAKQHAHQSQLFYDALKNHLGCDDSGQFSDLLWATDGLSSVADFDEALKLEGFEVSE